MKFSYQWDAEKQQSWGLAQLFKYIREIIVPYHPHYRKTFRENNINPSTLSAYADLRRIPLTKKQMLLDDPKSFILQPKFPGVESQYDTAPISKKKMLEYAWQAISGAIPVYPGLPAKDAALRERIRRAALREWLPMQFHVSGGTTGNPSPAVYTYYDIHNNVPPQASMVYNTGIDWKDKGLNLFPAAPHLAFFQTVFSTLLLGGSVFHTCGGAVIPTERQIEIADKMQFDYIIAIPSYLTHWLDTAIRMKNEGKISNLKTLRRAVVAAEPMVPAYREKIRGQFAQLGAGDIKIIEAYGMTEIRGAYYECSEGAGIHLDAEKFFWEMLDPQTQVPVEEGKPGVITFSHIDWRGSALLRYYTGDLVTGMLWNKCPACGKTSPRLITPMCRAVKDFTKIKGSRVPLLNLQTAVRNSEGVESFQIVITKDKPDDPFSRDWVRIHISLKPGASEDSATQAIRKNVKLDCEISPSEIIVEPGEKIEQRLFARTNLKADWVLDERQTL